MCHSCRSSRDIEPFILHYCLSHVRCGSLKGYLTRCLAISINTTQISVWEPEVTASRASTSMSSKMTSEQCCGRKLANITVITTNYSPLYVYLSPICLYATDAPKKWCRPCTYSSSGWYELAAYRSANAVASVDYLSRYLLAVRRMCIFHCTAKARWLVYLEAFSSSMSVLNQYQWY